jgi:hypothetical protein
MPVERRVALEEVERLPALVGEEIEKGDRHVPMLVEPAALVNQDVPLDGTGLTCAFCVPNSRTAMVTAMAAAPILTPCHSL